MRNDLGFAKLNLNHIEIHLKMENYKKHYYFFDMIFLCFTINA